MALGSIWTANFITASHQSVCLCVSLPFYIPWMPTSGTSWHGIGAPVGILCWSAFGPSPNTHEIIRDPGFLDYDTVQTGSRLTNGLGGGQNFLPETSVSPDCTVAQFRLQHMNPTHIFISCFCKTSQYSYHLLVGLPNFSFPFRFADPRF
jgi:hypothetical protein